MSTAIHSDFAPAAIGPYSQAIRAGNTLYCSGQIGLDPSTGALVEGLQAQVRRAFTNLFAVLSEAGFEKRQVVKYTLFCIDLKDFAIINEIMSEMTKTPDMPFAARSCVEVSALPKGALFEVEAIAVVD